MSVRVSVIANKVGTGNCMSHEKEKVTLVGVPKGCMLLLNLLI